MRHGWKTRMDERVYFEQKRYEREERQQLINLMRRKVESEIAVEIEKMHKGSMWNHETH